MPGEFTLLPYIQDGARGYRFISSGNQDVDGALNGTEWINAALTYSFPALASDYPSKDLYQGQGLDGNLSQLNSQQQKLVKYAFCLIESYTNLTFAEVSASGPDQSTIRLINTDSPEVPSALGFYPNSTNSAGDIMFGVTIPPQHDYSTPDVGNWGAATIMHEIGHALGLKHGHESFAYSWFGDYWNVPGLYGMPAITPEHDGQAWSLMTYSATPLESGKFYGDSFNQPQSYMQIDIAALQYLYGANFGYNAGDTVYKWTPDSGVMNVNGVAGSSPTSNKIFMTIWDGNGNDTYDLSAYATDLKINLQPGQFSTFSADQIANPTVNIGVIERAPGNIANALLYDSDPRSLIENAIGGSGNDTFTGNIANNVFKGNSGNDYMDGGSGINTSLYNGLISDYLINKAAGAIADKVAGRDGVDTIVNIQRLTFSDFTDLLNMSSKSDNIVYNLYQTAFGRFADESGFTVWANSVDTDGVTLTQVANAFISSPEFTAKYGANVANADFLAAAYQYSFGRAPDSAGLSYWTKALDAGLSKADLILAFASSPEEMQLTAGRTENGYWVSTDNSFPSISITGGHSVGGGVLPSSDLAVA